MQGMQGESMPAKGIAMASGEFPSCRVQVDGARAEVTFLDDMLHRQADLEQVYGELEQGLLEADKPELVMDISSVKHILSDSLGWLIHLARIVKSRGGRLRVIRPHRAVYRALEVARFTEMAEVEKPAD